MKNTRKHRKHALAHYQTCLVCAKQFLTSRPASYCSRRCKMIAYRSRINAQKAAERETPTFDEGALLNMIENYGGIMARAAAWRLARRTKDRRQWNSVLQTITNICYAVWGRNRTEIAEGQEQREAVDEILESEMSD